MDTLFLVGAGGVRNGWSPVIDAINSCAADNQTHYSTAEQASYLLALHVYRLRSSAAAGQTTDAHAFDTKLKNAICSQLQFEEIRLRARLSEPIEDRRSDVEIITTNWDRLLTQAFGSVPVRHLHGHCADAQRRLLLPSEIHSDIRDESYRKKHLEQLSICKEAVKNARRIVVYGLSFDPLDAELAVAVAEGFQQRRVPPDEVLIVDLASQQETLLQRINALWTLLRASSSALGSLRFEAATDN